MSSDGATGHWLAGLIDGEGCFRVHANERDGAVTTYATHFTLKLRDDDRFTLEIIADATGLGRVKADRSRSNGSHPCAVWVVDTHGGCGGLVRLLDSHPLRTRKAADYAVWRRAVAEWTNGQRGNRWHGPRDWSRMAGLKIELERARVYVPGGGR